MEDFFPIEFEVLMVIHYTGSTGKPEEKELLQL